MPIKRKMNLDSGYRASGSTTAAVKPSGKVERTITNFLDTEYRAFSNYTIANRALPVLVDGFKTGARKLMHAAFKGGLKDGSEKKVPTLVGECYLYTQYQHGDSSAVGTCMTMGAYFSDNLNPLDIVGQAGSLRAPNATAAPRYLFCKLSKYAKLYKTDEDLLEYVFDEGEYLEPKYYLPIIPLVLTSRNEGMAPGYKFSAFSYNPLDIIDAVSEVIKKGEIKTTIRPYVRGIEQSKFILDKETNRWWNIGEWEIDEKNDILLIKDFPFDVTYEKFEKKLNHYIDNGYIKDWKNFSHDEVIDYRILFPKTKLAREAQADRKEALLKKFMLQTIVPEDLLYVIDENGKVKHFTSKEDLIVYFTKFRLNKYNDRKDKLVTIKEKQYEDNSNLCKFIELVTSGKLKINNRKISEVKADLDTYKLPHNLLAVQLSKLTQEEKEEILRKNKEIEEELAYIKNTTIEDMYLNDLTALKKEMQSDFNK